MRSETQGVAAETRRRFCAPQSVVLGDPAANPRKFAFLIFGEPRPRTPENSLCSFSGNPGREPPKIRFAHFRGTPARPPIPQTPDNKLITLYTRFVRTEFHRAAISPRKRFHTPKAYFTAAKPPCLPPYPRSKDRGGARRPPCEIHSEQGEGDGGS